MKNINISAHGLTDKLTDWIANNLAGKALSGFTLPREAIAKEITKIIVQEALVENSSK